MPEIRFNNEITQIGDALELIGQLIRRWAEVKNLIDNLEIHQRAAIEKGNKVEANRREITMRSDRARLKAIEAELEKLMPIAMAFLEKTPMGRAASY